jgi:hypothetical protein
MRTEKLKEKWFEFTRHHCKEGFIDRWMGDSINDPNNDFKSNMQLNSHASFFRLNGTDKWVHRNMFRLLAENMNVFSETNSAVDIWNTSLINPS